MSTDWRQVLRTNFTNWKKLAAFLELNESQAAEIVQNPRFVLNLPLRLAKKIRKGTLEDPILKQFLPTTQEQVHSPGFRLDPVNDQAARCGPKLLKKYAGRVLLVSTSACAMHCRYCFRQNFEYEVVSKSFEAELNWIRNDSSLSEVILSGGDPLSLGELQLENLVRSIISIPHIKRLRFHTRFPVGIPERIDGRFLDLIASIPQQVFMIIHVNHPKELDEDLFSKIRALQLRRVIVANQAVLLRGVNDSFDVLKELCETLVNQGILPYYLHQLDQVQGAAHFQVSLEEGRQLMRSLEAALPGYAVPKYVCEIAGEPSKTAL